MAEREQRWTLWVDRVAGNVVRVGGPPASGCEGIPVVPAARLAEVERERDEARDQTERWADRWREACDRELALTADLARAREALERARVRLAQCERDRGERDKVLAQARTGMAEVDAALAAIKTREDGGGAMPDGTDTHPINEHGTTRCPNNGGIAAYVDEGECSSCGETVALAAPADREDGA